MSDVEIEQQSREEEILHAKCFQWFWNELAIRGIHPHLKKRLWHNQQKARNRVEGNRFKAMGVIRGVSDITLMMPGMMHFIELKTPRGTQSADQIEFQKAAEYCGFRYYLVRTFEQFKELILNILNSYYGN